MKEKVVIPEEADWVKDDMLRSRRSSPGSPEKGDYGFYSKVGSRISGRKLEKYYFQERGLCRTMFFMGSKTMVSGNWLVLS